MFRTLTVCWTQPLLLDVSLDEPRTPQQAARLTDDQREDLVLTVSAMPYRTRVPKSGRSPDLMNVLFLVMRRGFPPRASTRRRFLNPAIICSALRGVKYCALETN
jgi:hypothetical protein